MAGNMILPRSEHAPGFLSPRNPGDQKKIGLQTEADENTIASIPGIAQAGDLISRRRGLKPAVP